MATTIPTKPPTKFRAGAKKQWKISHSEYPAPTYTLKYRMVPKDGANNTAQGFDAAADGTDHLVTLATTTTDDFQPGTYTLIGYFEDASSDRIEFSETTLVITPDPTTATSTEETDFYRDLLKDAKEQLKQLNQKIIVNASVNGKSYTLADRPQLLTFIKQLEAQINLNERVANGDSPFERISTRFN